ncbi:MAG: hypothetical protein JNN17_06510 [Verrucomicrobiaceae bacterium]|jgi:hypothetical protein|nr:hypothetical protein [Verrucomicrobiaceae bacterium]
MKRLALLIFPLATFLLGGCVSPPSEKLKVKRVVVANFLEPKLSRFSVGFTVFGNRASLNERVDGLEQGLNDSVKAVAKQRFTDVVFLNNPPPAPPRRMYFTDLSEVYGGFAKTLAQQHQADAVMLVLPRTGFPYGVPRDMMATGIGVYHMGNTAQVEPMVDVLVLNGQTGRRYGFGVALRPSPTVSLPWRERFNDYSPSERQVLIQAIHESFVTRVARTVDMQGFRPRPQ